MKHFEPNSFAAKFVKFILILLFFWFAYSALGHIRSPRDFIWNAALAVLLVYLYRRFSLYSFGYSQAEVKPVELKSFFMGLVFLFVSIIFISPVIVAPFLGGTVNERDFWMFISVGVAFLILGIYKIIKTIKVRHG